MKHSDPPEIMPQLWSGIHGRLAFDIGARNGENIPVLRDAGFTQIIACEPEPDSFAQLERNFPDCDCRHIAVSAVPGMVDLAVVPGAISKGELVTPGTDGMEWSLGDWSQAEVLPVPATTLDELTAEAGTPDLVVIDTEGHEGHVMSGGMTLIEKRHTTWLIEFHSPKLLDEITGILSRGDYQLEIIRHPHYAAGSAMWHQHGWLKAHA